MTDYPTNPEDVRDFLSGLEYGDAPVHPAELPPPLRAEDTVTVTTSLRIPLELHQRVKKAAEQRNVTMSALIRDWIELELAALENDQPISRADALRALAALHPLRQSA
ncbi:CopG family transcriptional regulator [Nocardia arthritidis]|uniref:ribbon-helix-helix domain-containing protein n=1 Tax=Nocardia arthritidis TaxID=228602 RepID=UPI0007A4534B|nr:CopG family transcriptional regulator [Nocardia arthritidis]